jgi:acyl-CoA synthetase (AMP-forming)/AMP-acid ligase II
LTRDGNALPAGERGELLIRGTSVFRCYWNRPELEATTFEDGWFRTGDVATIDDEGYLFIVDRIKDLIIRGGENIGTGKVESVLLAHPDVLECAVYAVPDERLGEEVGATVYGTRRSTSTRCAPTSPTISPASRSPATSPSPRNRCRARHRARSSSASCATRPPSSMGDDR